MERTQQTVGPASLQWEFHAWHRSPAEGSPWVLADRHAALLWLRQFRQDPSAMAGLRSVLHAYGAIALPPGHSSDEQTLESLSNLLGSGILHVHRVAPPVTSFRGAERDTAPAESARRRTPAQSRPAPAPPKVMEEANTFSSTTDAAATAATLRSASEDGVPFCEECAKAAAAKEAA